MNWIVLSFYLVILYSIAFFSRRKKYTVGHGENHYLAGKSLNFIESFGSILATEVSALTFLGLPALGLGLNISVLYFYLGTLVARPLISFIIIPRIYGKGLTLYGIMGAKKSTPLGLKLTALIYAVTKLLGVGVRFYAGSILVSQYFGLSLGLTLLLITTATFFYTLIGGLKAVVRTDLFQISLLVGGGLLAHSIIPDVAGLPWGSMMGGALWKVEFLSTSKITPFLVGFTGGALFDFCTHSFDQDYAQRLLGARTKKTAQWAMGLSCLATIAIGTLFLSLGLLLWSHYQASPPPLGVKPDELFAHFITHHFPPPVAALMLGGVLAGTMSTLDSTINALSSVVWNDLCPKRNIKKIRSSFLVDTLIISLSLLAIAIVSSHWQGLFVLGMTISSWSVAALGVLFFSQLILKVSKLDAPTVLGVFLANLLGISLHTFVIEGPWQWNVYYGALGGGIFLVLKKYFSGGPTVRPSPR